jgi:thiosulfate/3-mercaptopyruvate sulfurtransferase
VSGPLVTSAWLRDRLDEPLLRVVDCRYKLGQPGAGESLYLEGHIPRAAYLDMDRDLASPPGDRGRHPLPDAGAFEAAARAIGISEPTLVVAYDEAAEGGAARLWWLLRHFGHDEVTVLDGGLRGWREEGGDLRTGPETIDPGDFQAKPPPAPPATADELEAATSGAEPATPAARTRAAGTPGDPAEPAGAPGASGRAAAREPGGSPVLLDARAPERYRGEVEPIDSVAGHIPGAVNLPFAELAPEGRFLAPEELRARFEAAGVRSGDDAVAYCGSGVTACVLVLAGAIAGIGPTRLYPGSWSEWSRQGRPVATGED